MCCPPVGSQLSGGGVKGLRLLLSDSVLREAENEER